MAARPRRLRSSSPGTAIGVAAALVALAIIAGSFTDAVARQHDRAADRSRAEADSARFETELTGVLIQMGQLATSTGASEPFGPAARAVIDTGPARGVALVHTVDDAVVHAATADGATGQMGEIVRDRLVQDALRAALAHAEARVAAPLHVGGRTAVVTVTPVDAPGTPADIEDRRRTTTEAVVAVVPFARLRLPPGQPALWPGSAVHITTGAGAFGPLVAHPVLRATIDVPGTVWRIDVGGSAARRPVVGWVVLLAGLGTALAAYVLLRDQHRERRRAEDEVHLRGRRLEMIATTSATLQQSLDLAELLPSFCVSIARELDLTGVTVLAADDDGNLVQAFATGAAGAGDETVTVELQRGWRTVGRLVATTARAVDPVTEQSLHALGDLLAIAVSNTQLFQREQQAVQRLSELDALKNAFLGTVSHELRTSVTAVLGFSQILTEHWVKLDDDRRQELAARVNRQAGSLRHLVDDLLDYARLEHKSLRVSPQAISLSELVPQLVDSMAPLLADHEVRVEADTSVDAWADPIAVERILANLLSNAGKYSPAGTTITIGVERHGATARLRVADQGPGIPGEERRRVFVRFYRLSNPETVRTRGAGIGLSILRDFATHSGASVMIDDAPGGGAFIAVDFPTEAAPEGAEG